MTDMLQTGAQWLERQRVLCRSTAVVYSRLLASVAVNASPGRTQWDVVQSSGIMEQSESRDFIVAASELAIGGQAITPQTGDRIVCDGTTYEVLCPDGKSCWRWADNYKLARRIYTKEVAP